MKYEKTFKDDKAEITITVMLFTSIYDDDNASWVVDVTRRPYRCRNWKFVRAAKYKQQVDDALQEAWMALKPTSANTNHRTW